MSPANAMRILFAPYSAVVWILAAFGVAWKGVGILAGRSSIGELSERLAMSRHGSPGRAQRFVINAVSVGEMAEAESLISSIIRIRPEAEFLVTTGNHDGRVRAERMQERFGSRMTVMYRPWDLKGPVKRWLRYVKPVALVTLETDIWPNLFRACNELGIPVFIVNGRVYTNDVWRYRIAWPSFRRLLSCVEWIGAQSGEDARRFRMIGADPERIEVIGNIKLDQDVTSPGQADKRLGMLSTCDGRVIVGGSTHAGEEALILDAFKDLRTSHADWRLVLAPRHVRRAKAVMHQAVAREFTTARWSLWDGSGSNWDVLVIDQVGSLPAIYSFGGVAILGGTLASHGGHNPAEAAIHGACLVVGPHCANFEEAMAGLEAAGGLVRTTMEDLPRTIGKIMTHPTLRAETGEAARQFVMKHRGVSDRYASEVLRRIKAGRNLTAEPRSRTRPDRRPEKWISETRHENVSDSGS